MQKSALPVAGTARGPDSRARARGAPATGRRAECSRPSATNAETGNQAPSALPGSDAAAPACHTAMHTSQLASTPRANACARARSALCPARSQRATSPHRRGTPKMRRQALCGGGASRALQSPRCLAQGR